MVVKTNIFKIFLICSNVLLLCAGLTVIILGVKMLFALSVLSLLNIPLVRNAVNAIIVAGAFISLCSLSGLLGGCNESKGLLLGHLIFLGVIVILEFSVGVTLVMVRKSVSAAVESSECNNVCAATFDAAILDYALPSAGLMMSIIFVEALMIYSSIRLYFIIRDKSGVNVDTGPSIVVQSVQTQNVTVAQAAFITQPQTAHAFQMEYTPRQSQLNSVHRVVGPVRRSHSNIEDKPPDYHSLSHYPSPYTNEMRYGAAGTSATPDRPEDTDDSFNHV